MTTNESGAAVTVVRGVSATPRQVFAAWTEPALMQRWLADVATVEPRVGGRFRQETRATDGQHVVSGGYREFVPDQRLTMTWRHGGPLDGGAESETVITVDLAERGRGKTDVRVTEQPVADWERADAEAAWNGALDALEAVFEDSPAQRQDADAA